MQRAALFLSALLAALPVQAQEPPLAWRVATGLAGLGPRPDGAPSQGEAARFLLDSFRRAGLREVREAPVAGHPEWVNLTGVLPGVSDREIVLSAHYDSVEAGPGAGDDASGCGVAVAAVADLARTPLSHTVRVVLFDAEEIGLEGSHGWVESLSASQRDRILADLNIEMVGWSGSPGPAIHTFPVRVNGEKVLAPGWLVHSILRSGDAVGWRYEMSDAQVSILAQLILRTAGVQFGADADSFQEKGIPALSVSDSSLVTMDPAYHEGDDTAKRLDAARLGRWTTAVAAAVRRLDKLSGRPLPEDEYLVVFGRVWLRRDLYWAGLALWILLVVRGRPKEWRFASAAERSRQGWARLPGFLFRMLFLITLLWAPVLTAVLLFPAALLAAFPWRRTWTRIVVAAAGFLPLLVYGAALMIAYLIDLASRRHGLEGSWTAAALVLLTAAAFVAALYSPGPGTPSSQGDAEE